MVDKLKDTFITNWISKITKNSKTYKLAKLLTRLYFRKSKKSFKIWLNFLFQQLIEAAQKRRLVVWANIYTPSEFLYSLNLIPIYPELISGVIASLGWSDYLIEEAESKLYSTDLCSFYRVAAGLILKDWFPQPDLVISSSQLCDGSTKFFNNISKYYNCEHYLIDAPYYSDQKAETYLANQLKDMAKKICLDNDKDPDQNKIKEAFHYSNLTREYIIKINQLRERIPSPLSGWEAMAYILYMFFSSLGSKSGLDFYHTLYQEVEEKSKKTEKSRNNEEKRLLWLHQIRPYYPNEILKNIQEHKGVISFEEVSYLYWSPLDDRTPWKSFSKKIISNFGAGPIERRINRIDDLINKYKINGVIHFSQRGCRQSCGGAFIIKDYLKKRKVPMLILDGDGADSRNYSKGQTRTRVEAFLEMLS
ncbi:MAG: 2-hydroxyacyl-CoA dehydratase family protein [Candidatus Caldatribacteriota bacterium]